MDEIAPAGGDGDDEGGDEKRGAGAAYHGRHDGRRINLEEVGLAGVVVEVVVVRWWVGRGG